MGRSAKRTAGSGTQTLDASDRAQLIHWAQELGVDPDIIQYAVEVMGPDVEEVRRYVDMFLGTIHRPARRRTVSWRRR